MTNPVSKKIGFTLIELMVALLIAGILAMIAYPSYQDRIRVVRRTDAIASALAIQVSQERFRGTCPFYAQRLGDEDICGASAAASTVSVNATSNDGLYLMSIKPGTATGDSYTIVARPSGIQSGDTECSPMELTFSAVNPQGVKTPAKCW